MKSNNWSMQAFNPVAFATAVLLFFVAVLMTTVAQAAQFVLSVEDGAGNLVSGFRYVLQEDATFPVDPANPSIDPDELLSLGFHASYHPVAKAQNDGRGLTGNADGSSINITNVRPGRYYVSVLPYSGHSISGMSVNVLPNAQDPDQTLDNVTVTVQQHPIPTTQIALYLFHDNSPINGAPDLPQETNPAPGEPGHVDWTQFNILVEEPAGRYGIAGGQVIQDAFGNPLGTSYIADCNPNEADCVDVLGDGTIQPLADGTLLIKNLAPGKYGIVVIPPTGSNWQQTTTIEGTKVIDAWVKANEPPFFVEFGPPGPHVFMGFLKSTANGGFPPLPPPQPGEQLATITGTITDMHMSRPPNFEFFSGRPFPGCWVGLNEANPAGLGTGLFAAPCDGDSNFTIPNVPPGSYQLKVFDANLDVVIASQGLTVDPVGGNCDGGMVPNCDFGEVAVFNWFTRLNTGVFNDANQNGFWDEGEGGILENQDVSLRWRDGTIYQNFPTDGEGLAPFDEVFPFFHWLVAEVSFGSKKATGATFVVDAGGEVLADDGWDYPSFDEMTPQAQACTTDDIGVTVAVVDNVGADGICYTADDTSTLCAAAGDPIENCNTGNNLSRTEVGQVLTAATQGFLGQVSAMHFGKADYKAFDFPSPDNGFTFSYVGENGGISGLVYYATTRAEDEPQFAAAEEWEPGVPRVQLALYADGDIDSFPLGDFPGIGDVDWNGNGIRELDNDEIDDINGSGSVELADVDNYPFGWSDPACVNDPAIPGNECNRGVEDIDRDDPYQTLVTDAAAVFDLGDAVQITWTDSWDDSLPTGCQGSNNLSGAPLTMFNPPVADDRCFDGLRNFNQVRPGVFDGGYAFADYDMTHLGNVNAGAQAAIQAYYDAVETTLAPEVVATLQLGLIPGDYIVEAVTPPGYKLMKEEDKNVDFGDEYIPSPQALAVACVGDERVVPPYLSMVTKDGSGTDPGDGSNLTDMAFLTDPGAEAPFAGDPRPLCDRKKVGLSAGQNAAAEFWVMTDVPIAGNVSGVILNDLGNEFNPNSPAFGEKFAPPNVPVGFYDWNGKEVGRVYADTYGRYNLVVPSTYTTNLPQPSGMSPNMLVSCMNDAGTGLEPDPYWNSSFSQFCYTFQYMPGAITYLDTPVEPIAAFASPVTYPVDCERPTTTPMIASVTRSDLTGPYVVAGQSQSILIDSVGLKSVDNPDWPGTDLDPQPRNIDRDYSFTAGCSASLEDAAGVRTPLTVTSCTADQVQATVQTGTAGDYQVVVTNPDGTDSPIGVTLTVGDGTENVIRVVAGDSIQAAIDAALDGDLILVGPGNYDELVIMDKAVKLQGWGAGVVTINARQVPTEKVQNWRALATSKVGDGSITELPGQEQGIPGFPALAEAIFPTEEGAGIFVAGRITKTTGNGKNIFTNFGENPGARIDGITVLGASTGGGIIVNGYAEGLSIGNNVVTGNAGAFGGAIRIGHPQLSHEDPDTGVPVYDDAQNDNIRIHHNHIAKNGGRSGGAGAGVSLHTGADNYAVQDNWICGNFTSGNGAGIGHLGLSDKGVIEDNMILFNESFAQAGPRTGGGIFIGGQPGLSPVDVDGLPLLLSPGSGSVTIDSNLIRGNLAGAGDGGGIQLLSVNGLEIADKPNSRGQWYRIDMINNMINNNVAALAGGGIALQDAAWVFIQNDTVAHNESTATAALAFSAADPNKSNATPAGIVAREHSDDFAFLMSIANVPNQKQDLYVFSNPDLSDSIIEHNRSFYWLNFDDPTTAVIETGLYPSNCPPGGTGTPDDPYTEPTNCDLTVVEPYSADLGVMDGPFTVVDPVLLLAMDPSFSLLTDNADNAAYIGVDGNVTGDPGFINPYFNGAIGDVDIQEFTTLSTAGAFDEGGNFIQVSYNPLSIIDSATGDLLDYHIGAGAAIDAGNSTLTPDFDDEPRPQGAASDIGADEAL